MTFPVTFPVTVPTTLRPLALALLLAAPAAAQDGCPTAADLARGVLVDYDDGGQDLFRATDRPGVVALERTEADGWRFRAELAQGFHVVTWENLFNGVTSVWDYGVPPEALPVPEPRGRWHAETPDPGTGLPLLQTHAYGEPGRLTIGGCAYDAFETLVVWHAPDRRPDPVIEVEMSRYLPELGIAVGATPRLADEPLEGRLPTAIRRAG